MAGRRPFSDGRSLSALDGAGRRDPSGLVCVCVGHAPRSLMAQFEFKLSGVAKSRVRRGQRSKSRSVRDY